MNGPAGSSPGRFLPPAIANERLLTPCLAIHLPTARSNVDAVLASVGGPARWRPHLKTTKIPELWSILLDAGVTRFKCATTHEMKHLLRIAPDADVLLAHHPTTAISERLADLARRFPGARLSTLCETPGSAEDLPPSIGAFVDVDPGMRRSGIDTADEGRIREVADACGNRLRGLHFYDGHLRDGDESSRRERAHAGYDRLLELDAALGGTEELVTSGTPTFLHATAHRGLRETGRHRVSPGTVVLHDLLSEALPEVARLGLEPAAAVLAHVVSHPGEDLVTINAGHKSVSADAGDPCCAILGHPDLQPLHPSEEHLPARAPGGRRPERGTLMVLAPRHVCPTVNLARECVLIPGPGEPIRTTTIAAGGHEPAMAE